MRPLKFHPILKQTLWGGERIIPYKELASELSRVGESWELSGMPGSESVVAEGPWTGSTLPELIGRFGAELLGKANYARFGQEFPLLVKFIDAREDLSIQVHPDDELARKRHGKSGKCEMWYVLEAEPGASLLTGFSDRTGGVRTSRCRQYIDRRFESPGNRIGRRLLSAGRTGAQHRKGVLHRRDPAKFGHHLPDLRFRPAGCSGQFPGVAYRIGTRSDRFRIFRKQPHNVRSGEQSGSPACHHALLYYVAIYPDRTNTLRLVGNGLFRGNSSASGEWFIDRQRRQSNRCPAGRNLVVARIDAMDRNHSAYGDPAPTDKPDLENPEFK